MEIKKTVYLVRHGQSVDNITPVFQSPDSPLSEVGIKQAESIAERISKLQFETLIASPFRRAKETAEAIENVTGKKIEFSDLFVERLMPTSIHGISYKDEQADIIWREWEKSLYIHDVHIEDGENFEDLLSRVDKALDFLSKRTEESVVVVTHGYFLRTIVARVLLGDTLSRESFSNFQKSAGHENTGITVLNYCGNLEESPRWRLWIYNDHAHLA